MKQLVECCGRDAPKLDSVVLSMFGLLYVKQLRGVGTREKKIPISIRMVSLTVLSKRSNQFLNVLSEPDLLDKWTQRLFEWSDLESLSQNNLR